MLAGEGKANISQPLPPFFLFFFNLLSVLFTRRLLPDRAAALAYPSLPGAVAAKKCCGQKSKQSRKSVFFFGGGQRNKHPKALKQGPSHTQKKTARPSGQECATLLPARKKLRMRGEGRGCEWWGGSAVPRTPAHAPACALPPRFCQSSPRKCKMKVQRTVWKEKKGEEGTGGSAREANN